MNTCIQAKAMEVMMKILNAMDARSGAPWSAQKELYEHFVAAALDATEETFPPGFTRLAEFLEEVDKQKKWEVLATPAVKYFMELKVGHLFTMKAQMFLELLHGRASHLGPVTQGPTTDMLPYLPPMIQKATALFLTAVNEALVSKNKNATQQPNKFVAPEKIPDAIRALLQPLKEVTGITMTTLLKKFSAVAWEQHEYCVKHDGARFGATRKQLIHELSSTNDALANWPGIIQKYGLDPGEFLPPPAEIGKILIFPKTKEEFVESIGRRYAKAHEAEQVALDMLENPCQLAMSAVVCQVYPPTVRTCAGADQPEETAASHRSDPSMDVHEWYSAIVARERREHRHGLNDAEVKELVSAIQNYFSSSKTIADTYEKGGGNLRVDGYDPTATVQKLKVLRVGEGKSRLMLWGDVIFESTAKRTNRAKLVYLGNGGDELQLPLYLDGSADVACNGRCCLGMMIPPLPKDAVQQECEAVPVDGDPETPSKKKQRVEKPKPTATHKLVFDPATFQMSWGKAYTYSIPFIESLEENDFDSEKFTKVNKGACYRQRTELDDHQFAKRSDDPVKPVKPAASWVTG